LTNSQTLRGLHQGLVSTEFVVLHAQFSVFTPEAVVSSTRLLSSWFPRWAQFFDGEPVVFPGVEGAPREIPRAIFTSRDAVWRCEIAPYGINVHWHRQQALALQSAEVLPPVGRALEVLLDYQHLLAARVGRLALVVTRVAQRPQPAILLSRHFCKERWLEVPLNRPENFELHAHKAFSLRGQFTVNSWVRNKSAFIGTPGAPEPVVVVEQDINTLAEVLDTTAFTEVQIQSFFDLARTESDLILDLYFPAEEGA
jgi:hypothetical protein